MALVVVARESLFDIFDESSQRGPPLPKFEMV
jgi:hypothetical protein